MLSSIKPWCFLIAVLLTAWPAKAQIGCPVGMPCIGYFRYEGANLVIKWDDTERRSHYNLRWSRPGKPERQVEISGGSGGQFTLKNFHRNTRYSFSVQGCNKPLIGRSTCTEWYNRTDTTCGSAKEPCR